MKKIIPFLILSFSFLFAKEVKIDNLSGGKLSDLTASEILIQLETMERNLKKLNSSQIGYLDRLKESLEFRTEETIENYKKNHTDDFYHYDPSESYIYKRWNANLRLIQRGAKKTEVLKHLKNLYQWNRLESEENADPEAIPIASKKTVYEKYFYTEYTKYLFYKVHCKTTAFEAVGEDCGPWPEYQEELNLLLKKYKIKETQSLEKDCECFGC
ncbi:hypothetical protein [Leptospira alstonii]|uniref:Uncharacterized protein n=2 Tax=Leptospira alstonii TaxID=28452 RepID=M6D323_9LEPT|nr:hypothetical protein [Leptospira alstonii]EMJ97091.1 hypothetical protein LEP1GSC194_3965 [Leptospira alstonii serovar Sichuan str. 79601]EQA81725.1 hypothetical protein LEP1GSC193_2959 [Leptospira alstonii serovar Pingchang str. 80-412]